MLAALPTRARLSWSQDGIDWPLREHSRFVEAAGLRWHVQMLGRGPELLLVHGTGASTHSWRGLAPRLAEHFSVIAPDLPGHGFSGRARARHRSLPGSAEVLAELLEALGAKPALAVGHSAGAAILCRMCLDGRLSPRLIVSLNGALFPLRGVASPLFAPLARLMSWNPIVAWALAARAARPEVVGALMRDTGSKLDTRGLELYGRLMRSPSHVAAALAMMARWDLRSLARDLPRLAPRLVLMTGSRDRFIDPSEALRVQSLLPGTERLLLPSLGHLAHEEDPEQVAQAVLASIRRHAPALLEATQ